MVESVRKLSNAQAYLLQLFERDLPEKDLKEVKNMLTKFFFEKAEKAADNALKEKGISIEEFEREIEKMNDGNRTEILKSIRNKKDAGSN